MQQTPPAHFWSKFLRIKCHLLLKKKTKITSASPKAFEKKKTRGKLFDYLIEGKRKKSYGM